MRALVVLAVLAAAPAAADEGELHIGGAAEIGGAWLRHPLAPPSLLPDASTAFAFLPRIALTADVGITNDLHAGVVFAVAATPNVVTNAVTIGGVAGNVVTGAYGEGFAGLNASWRIDSGYDLCAILAADIGPVVTFWSGSAFADPTKLDASGKPARLPFDVTDELQVGPALRLTALFDWRIVESFALRAGPTLLAAWTASPTVRVGIVVEAGWLTPVGPR
ncbi:MAG: hypothetical protein HYS27_22870 [Deltaproteobacteria bacterium]|nr:hypothetical protein [Deltaproteobacteria bacterium]